MKYQDSNLVITTSVANMLSQNQFVSKTDPALYITEIIRNYFKENCQGLRELIVIAFSEEEMLQFVEFYYNNPIMLSIGFKDSSALYYALKKGFTVIVMDEITENVCKRLNINTIYLEGVKRVIEHLQTKSSSVLSISNNERDSSKLKTTETFLHHINEIINVG